MFYKYSILLVIILFRIHAIQVLNIIYFISNLLETSNRP